jgi:hypothetical protein
MTFDTGLRRRLLIQGAAAAAALPGFYIGSAAAQQTLKIGMVIAKQGPFAQQGGDLAKGVQMAFDEAGAKVLGRPAELMWLDEANPQGAVQNITKLIEEEKAIAVLGGTSSATSLAMGSVALRAKVPFIFGERRGARDHRQGMQSLHVPAPPRRCRCMRRPWPSRCWRWARSGTSSWARSPSAKT